MKLGFIGGGNMASAIIRGIVRRDFLAPENIVVFDTDSGKLKLLAVDTGIQRRFSAYDVVQEADMILLAVKPNVILQIAEVLKDSITHNRRPVISIAAGTSLEKLEQALGHETPIVRVMPNINLTVGAGAAAVCGNRNASRETIDFVLQIFRSAGTAVELEEKYFSVFSAIAGCSPAYAFLFIDSLARAAVRHGLPKEQATLIAAQAVFGSARMVLESPEIPWALIDKVCSPGGTTIEGLLDMEDSGFISAVVRAVDSAVRKDKALMG
ncbi:MAG: pyrroline-5-carboxylate reductase [Methylobacteriaceae bacterium]|jgi:pyrroline-5-carboxylate reductase|nr:pyrroline-5-carboxylate reductase [Methylobacteriaceae bacterium]